MFLRWLRTPPMPGIGCPGTFYIRCPGNRKIGIFRSPENPDFQKSGHLEIWISGFPEIRIFGNRNSEIPENQKIPDLQVFRLHRISGNRKNQQSGKKASDVEFADVEFP